VCVRVVVVQVLVVVQAARHMLARYHVGHSLWVGAWVGVGSTEVE
jgi:hypothetical protein